MDNVTNFAVSNLSAGIDSSATTISLVSGGGSKFPSPPFNVVLWNTNYGNPADDPNVEIVRVTAISGDSLTVTRGQEGTTASAHNDSGAIYRLMLPVTAKTFDDISAHINSQLNPHNVTKEQVGINSSDDVPEGSTNKYDVDHFSGKTQDDLPNGTTYKQYNPANVAITGGSISGITPLAIADGGTGANNAATARSNIGAIGSVSDDTAPTLGGNLNANTKTISFTEQTSTGTINWSASNKWAITLTANVTLTFINPPNACNLVLRIIQDSNGGHTVTFPSSVKWVNGSAPTLSSTANAVDVIEFYYAGGGYYAVALTNFS